MKRILTTILLLTTLGALLGVIGGYGNHLDEVEHGSSYSRYERDFIACFALPGLVASSHLHGVDFRLTEPWTLYAKAIVAANALFYGVWGLIIILIVQRLQPLALPFLRLQRPDCAGFADNVKHVVRVNDFLRRRAGDATVASLDAQHRHPVFLT